MRYQLRLTGDDQLRAEPPQVWRIQVSPDKAPAIELEGEGLSNGLVGRDEVLLLKSTVTDDVGLRSVELLIQAGHGAQRDGRRRSPCRPRNRP